MNASTPANNINIAYQDMLKSGYTDSKMLLSTIAKELDAEFQKGVTTLKNVDITTPAGSLSFSNVSGLTNDNAYKIASDVASYWAKTIAPSGTPESCRISSVVNDASKIIAPIASGLLSLYNGNIETPSYFKFCDIIISNVKTIIWQVDESSPKCSADFVVRIT
jgi:hypothetical protein